MSGLNRINTYPYGSTVRLQCSFFDFNGEKIDPTIVRIIIYTSRYEQLLSETVGGANRTDIGVYHYDYTTEKKDQRLYYEWYGEIDGKPSLKRGSFMTKFM